MRSTLAILVSTLVAGLAAPAAAGTWHAPDPHGDVTTFAYSPDPPPCGTDTEGVAPTDARHDIRKLAVDHEDDTIKLRLTLGEVSARDDSTSYTFHVLVPRGAFYIDVVRFKPGKPLEAMFAKEPNFDSVPVDECGGSYIFSMGKPCDGLTARASGARDRIEVVLPRSCVKDPRWVKVGADALGFSTTDASGSFTLSSDEWAVPGDDTSGYLPPYGPRVHRGT